MLRSFSVKISAYRLSNPLVSHQLLTRYQLISLQGKPTNHSRSRTEERVIQTISWNKKYLPIIGLCHDYRPRTKPWSSSKAHRHLESSELLPQKKKAFWLTLSASLSANPEPPTSAQLKTTTQFKTELIQPSHDASEALPQIELWGRESVRASPAANVPAPSSRPSRRRTRAKTTASPAGEDGGSVRSPSERARSRRN